MHPSRDGEHHRREGPQVAHGQQGNANIVYINFLELLAIFLALRSFVKEKGDVSVLLLLDNVTAIALVYQQDGRYSFSTPVRPGSGDLGLVHSTEYHNPR